MTTELLTLEKVMDLADGALLNIRWSGGNGPYVYRLESNAYGRKIVTHHPENAAIDGIFVENPEMAFIGLGAPMTHVTLAGDA